MPTSSHQMEFGSGGGGGGDDEERKWRDREALRHIIGQWNANRLDLFSLSEPNEEFEFHGVMRFYFQDAGQKIATKCIRVSSTASTQAVIETLIEKFRPDMKMLHMAAYALYEIHPNGEERCLGVDEKPLLVQLNWHKDDREGRFLLRRADEKSTLPATQPPEESSFRRKLSKREKRNAKKENKLRKLKSSDGGGGGGNDGGEGGGGGGHDSGVAEKLYTELPETSFTRSISNPEAVMRRRRQQKLERKLQLFRSKDGGPDTGGTLKIYGESLCRDVPYKTLLLSVRETAAYVVREMLDKYGLNREDPTNFCLVQVTPASPPSSPSAGGGNEPPPHEYILEDDECPLSILMNHTPGSGPVMFHVRRRPNDSSAQAARRRKKKLSGGGSGAGGGSGERGGSVSSTSTLLMQHHQAMGMASSESRGGGGHHHHHHPTAASAFAGGSIGGAATGGGGLAGLGGVGSSSANAANPNAAMDEVMERWPYLVELNPDGSEVRHMQQPARRHLVTPGTVTEVGSDTVVHHTVATAAGRNGGGGAAVGIQLFGPGIQPRHCVLAQTEGMVTLTPCSPHAETYVNGQRLCETTLLRHGCVVRFGRPSPSNAGGAGGQQFRFVDPTQEFRTPAASTAVHYDRYTGQPGPPPPSSTNASVPVAAKAAAAGQQQQQQHGTDPILPAVLELPEEVEDAFLHSLIPNLDARQQMAFRLAPTYALYLMARYRASTHFRPELNPMERAQRLTLTLSRVGAMMQAVVQERYADPPSLAFWMANASELLHFLKSDRHICAFSLDGQDLLAEAVQIAFRNASACLTAELLQSTPPLLSPPNPTIITPLPSAAAADDEQQQQHDAADESATAQVLAVLSSTMGLLRRCRVNAALTIQLFSQLFHALNAALFNRLVGMDTPRLPGHSSGGGGGAAVPNMCSRQWGMALARRLKRLEAWAERQGLELAADCHLARVMQAAHLLQSPKQTAEQLIETAQSCFKLNSLQLRALLERYHGDGGQQQQIPAQLIAHIVRVAETTSDELQLADGRPLRLDEDSHLQVPFLLPDDGYSCDVMRGVPQGLHEVIGPLQQAGLCRLTPQPTSSGLWTIYMGHEGGGAAAAAMMQPATSPQPPPMAMQQPHRPASAAGGTAAADYHQQQQQQPELQLLQLRKASDSMGLSIVAARGTGQQQLGIYIKSVVKGGSADLDGRLQAGDQLLSVDGYSLVGITQDRAAEILMRTSHTVRLEVARQAAMYHGLATLLSQPSPPNSAHTSRSTLSLNKIPMDGPSLSAQQQQQQRGGVPSSAAAISGSGMRPPQQSQSYQERLVDWDRPSHQQMMMTSSNSMGELASVQQQQQPARPPSSTGMRQQTMATATSRSVSALHDQQQQQQHAAEASFAAQQQQQHQQMMQRQQMMGNQRAVSAQHLVPPQQQQQQQQRHSGGAMPMQMNQQQMPLVLAATDPQRSRSVQNLSEAQQRAAAMMTQQQQQRARHPSNPSAAAAASEDERQYQNIALYQQQQQQQTMGRPQQQQQSRAQLLLSPQQAVGGSARSVSSSVGGGPLAAAHLRQTGPSQSSESPPPPPPPPVSTHPLLAVGGAGGGGTAWEREERERQEAMRRQEAARQWMQEQIDELESLPASQRTTKQEEQLRSLRLEMEFRKRAMEAAAHEDDEDGDEDGGEGETAERRGMLRLVQEDLERARQWRLEKQQMQQLPLPPSVGSVGGPPQQQQPLTNGGGGGVNNNNTSTVPDQERMRKIEAFQRKQRELEATQAAEERIIREAQRRKEDEMLLQHQQRHLQQQQQQHQQWRPQPGNVPIPPSHHSSAAAAAAPSQRLDSLIVASSSSSQESHVVTNVATTTKRVSFFQEPATTDQHQQQHHQQQRSSREEADAFITEAENMLSSTGAGTTSPPRSSQQHHQITQMMEQQQQQQQLLLTGTSTPGVIGAQEVYRDPRARRLAEQQLSKTLSQAQAGKTVPEKLTFAEKMRMFALESGEEAAPKDKSKHSSKQREIEQLGTAAAAAAAAPGGPNTATKQQIK